MPVCAMKTTQQRPPPLWRGRGAVVPAIALVSAPACRDRSCRVAATAGEHRGPASSPIPRSSGTSGAAAPPVAAAAATRSGAADPSSSEQQPRQRSAADADAAIAAARALYEVAWTKGDIRVLDRIMAADHVQNDAVWQPEGGGGGGGANPNPRETSDRRAATAGRDRLKRGILAYRAAYPDVAFEVLSCAASEVEQEDDPSSSLWRVFVHWRAAGTNTGPIRDAPPTGRRAEFSGVNVATVRVMEGEGQLLRSDVYRQAPADEAAYFLGKGAVVGVPSSDGGGRR